MNLNRNLFGALAFCAALSAPLGSWAAVTVVSTQAAFNALVGVSGVDTFDDLLAENIGPVTANRMAGTFLYTAGATDGLYFFPGLLSTATAVDSLVFSNFSAGVYGFAANFFAQDLAGVLGSGELTIMYNGNTIPGLNPLSITPAGQFVGLVFDAPISGEITVTSSNVFPFNVPGGTYLAVDNVMLASAVPELGTFPLIVVGAGALVAASLRRRRVA